MEIRSSHFSVVTDAGEKRGHEVALRFEQMRAVFGALAQAQQFKQMLQAGASGPPAGGVLVRKEDSAGNSKPATPSGTSSSGTPAGGTNFGAAKFIRGTLGSVDCSTDPAATLTIVSGFQALKMQIADRNRVVLIGADQFSCSWTTKRWPSTTAREVRTKHR